VTASFRFGVRPPVVPAAAMVSALVFHRDGRFGAAWPVVSFWLGWPPRCQGR
jgi:hypothetical protein